MRYAAGGGSDLRACHRPRHFGKVSASSGARLLVPAVLECCLAGSQVPTLTSGSQNAHHLIELTGTPAWWPVLTSA